MGSVRQKIGLLGNFGGGNLGNEGSLEAMIAFLRQVRPDAELICLCPCPEEVTRRYGISAMHYRAPRKHGSSIRAKLSARIEDVRLILRGVRGFNVMIVPGTGLLDDFGERPLGLPFTLFSVCLLARLRGIKICFVSIGAGPITNRWSRWLMKTAAALAHYRSYRDSVSKDFMRQLGLDVRRDEIYPDIAFRLAAPATREEVPSESRAVTIGVGMMTYNGWRADPNKGAGLYATYLGKMTAFVLWLLDSGYNIRVLTGEDSDARAVSDLTRRIVKARPDLAAARYVAEPATNLHELMAQMAQTDIVVATRFHNVVCALKAGRPTASLGYSAKNAALLASMGLGEFCQHVESFDVELLKTHVMKLLKGREIYTRRLEEANSAFQKKLRRQEQILTSSFLATPASRA
jgi:polysaccharide pyruvyl transferase WcaK-like protein